MDKGAHFFKCDFQVHTPRDEGWKGGDAVTEAERKVYAEELVLACRTKGIGAIAITDHHDLAFFPYVKKAAREELDDTGQHVPENRRLVVFPGVELTLTSPTCQALLLLDAEFPDNLFQSVLTTIGITPAPSADSRTSPVERIPQDAVNGLPDLYDRLNVHEFLKGRFIILPNVSEGGGSTLLRQGFGGHYKTMPCVGGYVDGDIGQLGDGNKNIIAGKNREYGFKSIGVFQTSDSRHRNHGELGKFTTWVKWSEPTAEALRQACLAKESRLSQSEPELPTAWITSLTVSNSKFLGHLDLEFSQQYSAIIGGRGSGKSTILEYLRWGLCDQPTEDDDSEIAPVQAKRKSLINETLQKREGEVHVTFLLNEVRHIVKRNSKAQTILLKVGDGDFVPTTEQDIRNLLPIQAYSQKQLSSVGVRLEELRRFVELPIKHALDQIKSDIRDLEAKIRVSYVELLRKRAIEGEVAKYTLEIDSLNQQVSALRKTLKGLSKEDDAIIRQKALFDNEELIIEDLKNELARAAELIGPLEEEDFSAGIGEEREDEQIHNTELIGKIRKAFELKFKEINIEIKTLAGLLTPTGLKAVDAAVKEWDEKKEAFEKKYEDAKKRANVNQQQLTQIAATEKRIGEIKKIQLKNKNDLTNLGDPEKAYRKLRGQWNDCYGKKIKALDDQCKNFSSLSSGLIKVDIKRSLDVESLKERFKVAFAGLNIKEQKIEGLCDCVVKADDPVNAWNSLMSELETIASHNTEGIEPLPASPEIDKCGIKQPEKQRIASGLDEEKWLDLSLAELEFNPVFQYCTNPTKKEYIPFVDASAGQQATALFTALLNQEGAPLIIDQPEDDVDSKLVQEIVARIWTAKSKRQLIFASHNANFVVNGDAELVICCDYRKAGDQTAGHIKNAGAIDNEKIREEITLVTEGGKDAFKLRKEKYGF